MNKKKKTFLIIVVILLILEMASIFLMYKTLSSENNKIKNLNVKYELDESKFALMLENSNGNGYTEVNLNKWPTNNYSYNDSKSNCIDQYGNIIPNALIFKNGVVQLKTKTTSYCYIYFDLIRDISKLCQSGNSLGSCLKNNRKNIISLSDNSEGGMYRYQGDNNSVDNYICFGTSNKNTCLNNQDKYMYRIIGINESSQVKLIKKEALDNTMQWWASLEDVPWYATAGNKSLLYTNLNGNDFLNNTTYIPNGWKEKIADVSWKYGDTGSLDNNANYTTLYNIEKAWSNVVSSKIALMYASDYLYSYPSANCMYNSSGICNTAWMYIGNNDSNSPSKSEWTMNKQACVYGGCNIITIEDGGAVQAIYSTITSNILARPVFYIKNDEIYVSGKGTTNDPIILKDPNSKVIEKYPEAIDLEYNGENQLAQWLNYDYETTDISGTLNATNPGSYTATFTPKAGYAWPDGTNNSKDIVWKINKSPATILPLTIYLTENYVSETINVQTYPENLKIKIKEKNLKFSSVTSEGTQIKVEKLTTPNINDYDTFIIEIDDEIYLGAMEVKIYFVNPQNTLVNYLKNKIPKGFTVSGDSINRFVGYESYNYVQLGNDKTSFRIIGITGPNSEIKLVKTDSIFSKSWGTKRYYNNIKWEDTKITILNEINNFYSVSNNWGNKIASLQWNKGAVINENSCYWNSYNDNYTKYYVSNFNGPNVLEKEEITKTEKSYKYGLISLSDYYFANNTSGTNWLWDLTDEQGDGTQMWTLTTGNIGSFTKPSVDTCNSGQYEFYIWGLTKSGNQKVNYSLFASDLSGQVYPTFYLSSEIKIIEKTDSNYGTYSNPFILIY